MYTMFAVIQYMRVPTGMVNETGRVTNPITRIMSLMSITWPGTGGMPVPISHSA